MKKTIAVLFGVSLIIGVLAMPQVSGAHCDTMNGPVVITAKAALDKGDVTPVLKWIHKEDEAAIREAFGEALAVRSKGPEARELADRYFFETLVRIHRAGEGAPYTGLKSEDPEEVILASDRAMESKSSDALVKEILDTVSKGIQQRFNRVVAAKEHADHNVDAGREFVEAYVDYMHYVERLHMDAIGSAGHHAETQEAEAGAAHNH